MPDLPEMIDAAAGQSYLGGGGLREDFARFTDSAERFPYFIEAGEAGRMSVAYRDLGQAIDCQNRMCVIFMLLQPDRGSGILSVEMVISRQSGKSFNVSSGPEYLDSLTG